MKNFEQSFLAMFAEGALGTDATLNDFDFKHIREHVEFAKE